MDELGRKLAETQDKKIIEELYELALKLEKMRRSDRPFQPATNTHGFLSLPYSLSKRSSLILHFHVVCLVELPR